MKQKGQ